MARKKTNQPVEWVAVAVLTADCHLEHRGRWADRPTLQGDSFNSFEQVINIAVAKRLPVIVAGDLFNTVKPDSATVKFYLDQVARLEDIDLQEGATNRCNLWYVDGNHDRCSPSWAALHPYARHITPQPQLLFSIENNLGPFQIAGVDNGLPDKVIETINDAVKSPVDLLVLHQAAEKVAPAAQVGKIDCSVFRGKTRAILIGDIHVRKQLTYTERGVDVWDSSMDEIPEHFVHPSVRVLSPGSTHLRSIDEDPVKCAWIWYANAEGQYRFESMVLSTRPVLDLDLREEEAPLRVFQRRLQEFVATSVGSHLDGWSIVRVRCTDEQYRDQRLAEAIDLCKKDAHVFLTVQDTSQPIVIAAHALPSELGRQGLMTALGVLAPDKKVAGHAVQLLEAADRRDVAIKDVLLRIEQEETAQDEPSS